MKKKALFASAVAAALGLAASAKAAYTLEATPYQVNPSGSLNGSQTITLTGYTSYILTLNSNNPSVKIAAYDFANSGWKIQAINGATIVQAYNNGGTSDAYVDNLNPISAGRTSAAPTPPGLTPADYRIPGSGYPSLDSAMLNFNPYWTSGPSSAKVLHDYSVTVLNNSDNSDNTGASAIATDGDGNFFTGSTLIHGAAGIDGEVQTSAIPVAFVIVPTGTIAAGNLIWSAGIADSSSPNVKIESSGAVIPAAVPEPASIGLFGLGALGLIARRRRA